MLIPITSSSLIIQTSSFHWPASPRRIFLGNLTLPVIMLSTLSRRHSPLLLFSLIGFPMLNSLWNLMHWTMVLLQFSLLLIKIMKFIQLLFTPILLLWQSWITIHTTRNCLPFLKLSRFSDTIWKVQPIPLTLLWIIKMLSIFLLPRYWPRGKHSGLSTFLSSTLSSGSILVILAPNLILSLDSETSILKRRILAMPQSTLTTSSPSSLKNNLQSPYKLWSSFSLLFAQLQS